MKNFKTLLDVTVQQRSRLLSRSQILIYSAWVCLTTSKLGSMRRFLKCKQITTKVELKCDAYRGLYNGLVRRVNEHFSVKRVTWLAVAGLMSKIMPYVRQRCYAIEYCWLEILLDEMNSSHTNIQLMLYVITRRTKPCSSFLLSIVLDCRNGCKRKGLTVTRTDWVAR